MRAFLLKVGPIDAEYFPLFSFTVCFCALISRTHCSSSRLTPFPTAHLVANFICQLSLSLFYCFFCCSFASLEVIITALVMEVVVVMVVNLFKGSSVSHSFTSQQIKTVTRSMCYRVQSLPPLLFATAVKLVKLDLIYLLLFLGKREIAK